MRNRQVHPPVAGEVSGDGGTIPLSGGLNGAIRARGLKSAVSLAEPDAGAGREVRQSVVVEIGHERQRIQNRPDGSAECAVSLRDVDS